MATFVNSNFFSKIAGGWKTVGAPGVGAFASTPGVALGDAISESEALKLSAYYACVRLLADTAATLSFRVLDAKGNELEDHDLHGLLGYDVNKHMTGDAFVCAMSANRAVYGNAMGHIRRFGSTGKAYAIDFYSTDMWDTTLDEEGRPVFSINGETVPTDDVLHWSSFSTNGYWGIGSLQAGAQAMLTQVASNQSAAATFKTGLRAGGFFTLPENRQAFSNEQLENFKRLLAEYSRPENINRWLPLLPGMGAVANTNYRIDPVTAELLKSRYFGIEEICRFMGVPPPLIGHTDKASSWASSIENLNQFLVTYTMLPMMTRFESQIARKLLGPIDRRRYRPNFNMDTLLRGDIEKRFKTYEIAIDRGIYSPNDARSKEKLPPRAGGDVYADPTKANASEKKKEDDNE